MNGGQVARRLGIVVVCAVSLAGCVGLAWWQWERFESATGSWQNLGYVLQWPLFGLFPAFMFWRLRKLRSAALAPQPAPEVDTWQPAPRPPAPDRQDDDDPELAEYNRYLARLSGETAQRQQEPR